MSTAYDNLNEKEIDSAKLADIELNTVQDFTIKEKPIYSFVKRLLDIIFSATFMIVLLPLFIIISIVILIDDHSAGSIFKQERCGKNGKIFTLYKFRTMCPDAEKKLDSLRKSNEMDGPVFKIKKDPRITKVGSFLRATSLDELPQLLNIFLGDMSIVGPRPALPKEVEKYLPIHRARLLVKPGLTCYWQVEPNRNSISFDGWMELDRKYISERSLLLDLKLVFKTFIVVFNREGC